MDEANGPAIPNLLRVIFFVQQNHVCFINQVEASEVHGPKCVKRIQDVYLDDRPSPLVEHPSEPMWTRRLVGWHVADGFPYFLSEQNVELSEVEIR